MHPIEQQRWPSRGPWVMIPCLRTCHCGATWLGTPSEFWGLTWWELFRMPY